jgi:hypothetical protein
LISALIGDEWSASRPDRFVPGEKTPGTHWIEGCVALQLVYTTWRREKSYSCRVSNSYPSAVQTVANRYTDCAIRAPTDVSFNAEFIFSLSGTLSVRSLILFLAGAIVSKWTILPTFRKHLLSPFSRLSDYTRSISRDNRSSFHLEDGDSNIS